jgi:hypothetical protein
MRAEEVYDRDQARSRLFFIRVGGGRPTFKLFVKAGIHAACGSGRFWEFGLVEIKIPSLRRERERLGHPAN